MPVTPVTANPMVGMAPQAAAALLRLQVPDASVVQLTSAVMLENRPATRAPATGWVLSFTTRTSAWADQLPMAGSCVAIVMPAT